jgi:DNA-binding FadR family transcriptional regulator
MACIPLFTYRIVHSHLQKDQVIQSLMAHEAIFKAIEMGDCAQLKTVVRAAIQGGAEISPDQTENDGRLSVRQRSGAKNKDGAVRG